MLKKQFQHKTTSKIAGKDAAKSVLSFQVNNSCRKNNLLKQNIIRRIIETLPNCLKWVLAQQS